MAHVSSITATAPSLRSPCFQSSSQARYYQRITCCFWTNSVSASEQRVLFQIFSLSLQIPAWSPSISMSLLFRALENPLQSEFLVWFCFCHYIEIQRPMSARNSRKRNALAEGMSWNIMFACVICNFRQLYILVLWTRNKLCSYQCFQISLL